MSGRSIKRSCREDCAQINPSERGINLTPLPPYSPLAAGFKRRDIDYSAVEILALI